MYTAGMAAAFICLALLFIAFVRKAKGGGKGNAAVKSMLEKLGKDYAVFSDVVVPAQHGMSHIDFVLVSPYGVFVVDVKHEGGKISGDLNDREWEVGGNETIYNPVWRNRTHLNGLEKLLGEMSYISLVVFVNGRLKGDFGSNVVELSQMKAFIKKYQRETLPFDRLEAARKLLESGLLDG
ncbi:MAG: nuclease-related domain-containing protein [Nitrospinales bacterium]